MHFEPLRQPMTAVDRAAAALRAEVLRSETNTKLPPERQLAEHLRVGRATLRSALGRLVSERLLKTKQGSGYEVLNWREEAGPVVLGHLIDALPSRGRPELVKDLLMVRRYLALALVHRLVERQADLTEARSCLELFKDAGESGESHRELAELDLQIVRALARASGSLVLQLTLNSVASVLRASENLQRAMFRDPSANVAAYSLAFDWLGSIPGECPRPLRGLRDSTAIDAQASAQILSLLEANDRGTLEVFTTLDSL